jgi:AcrR family transcriptional regulator
MARPAAKHGKRSDAQRLGRDDWLDAAFDAVVDGGFDQLRVVALAQTLGVTRGSFYWHFSDHADLVKVLLARWQQREIADDLRIQAESSDDPQADLLRLLDLALARGGADLKNLRFELALRGLGRRDSGVAQMLVEVDAARMALFEAKFLRLTRDAKSATDLAALFYLAVTGGFQALARPNSSTRMADYIRGVIADHLIRRQAVAVPAQA